MLRLLESLLTEVRNQPATYAVGKVTAYTAGPPKTISVTWDGSTIPDLPWPKDSSYTPVVGDVVLMARFGAQLLPLRIY